MKRILIFTFLSSLLYSCTHKLHILKTKDENTEIKAEKEKKGAEDEGNKIKENKRTESLGTEKSETSNIILDTRKFEKLFPSEPYQIEFDKKHGWTLETFYPELVNEIDIDSIVARSEEDEVMEEIEEKFYELLEKIPPEEIKEFEKKWSVDGFGYFNIPVEMNKYVDYYIYLFTETKYREHLEKWLERYFKYSDIVRRMLREQGLPDDLIFVAMAESGFSNRAVSPMSAVGMWQFIKETAQRYGLKIDFWIDERRDFVKATKAAMEYLKDLYNMFGDWYLAWAGYNGGERKIFGAIQMMGKRDFWSLAENRLIPRETSGYVPKIIALALITKNLDKFGFNPDDFIFTTPITFDEVKINQQIDVFTISKICGCSVEEIIELNPHLRQPVTPPYEVSIRVPAGRGELVREKLKILEYFSSRYEPLVREGYYLPFPSETYSRRIQGGWLYIYPNKQLSFDEFVELFHIPEGKFSYVRNALASGRAIKIPIEVWTRPFILYRVRRGDTIYSISRKFGVSVSAIKRVNGLKKSRIVAGRTLKIPLSHRTQYASTHGKRVSGESPSRSSHDLAINKAILSKYEKGEFILHKVRAGETLYGISKKYSIPVSVIKRVNGLRSDTIYPGQRLYIPITQYERKAEI